VVVQEGESDNRDLWIRDTVRGAHTFVNDTATTEKDYAGWDAAGENLFYFDDFSTFGLYTVPADGSGQPRRIGTGLIPFCSADGKTLYFVRKKKDVWDFDIWRQPVDGDSSDAELLLDTPAVEWWTPPSPDGRYLLYSSDESGEDEVYATALPDFRGRWQVSNNGGTWPRWRADGKEIYYAVGDSIMVVDADTEGGLLLGTPRLLFRQPEYPGGNWPNGFDVTADGERFVVLRPVLSERSAPEIVVVQNWVREFGEGR
jgi:Tol biopolymer transport system component